jgi:hypothetical protein
MALKQVRAAVFTKAVVVAIPAAVALFHIDVTRVKVQLLTAAILFVAGLLLVSSDRPRNNQA